MTNTHVGKIRSKRLPLWEKQRQERLVQLLRGWMCIEFEHESAQEPDQGTQERRDEDDSGAYRGA